MEKLNCNVKKCNLFCLHVNFYPKKGKTEHWVEMYFKIETEEKLPDKEWTVTEEDKDDIKIFHYKWVTRKKLESIDLKPTSIKKLMVDNKTDEFNYIIDEIK